MTFIKKVAFIELIQNTTFILMLIPLATIKYYILILKELLKIYYSSNL